MTADQAVRLVALGSVALTDGFALLGFETHPDADCDQLNRVLRDLLNQRVRAMVFVEPGLCDEAGPLLEQIRDTGGHILVTEVPPLHMPHDYQSDLDALLTSVLGSNALEKV